MHIPNANKRPNQRSIKINKQKRDCAYDGGQKYAIKIDKSANYLAISEFNIRVLLLLLLLLVNSNKLIRSDSFHNFFFNSKPFKLTDPHTK